MAVVLGVVAVEKLRAPDAVDGEDVGADAVQEPPVVGDHDGRAGELLRERAIEGERSGERDP